MVILRQPSSEGLIESDSALSLAACREAEFAHSLHGERILQLGSLYKQHLRRTSKRKPKLNGLFKEKDLKAYKKKKDFFLATVNTHNQSKCCVWS